MPPSERGRAGIGRANRLNEGTVGGAERVYPDVMRPLLVSLVVLALFGCTEDPVESVPSPSSPMSSADTEERVLPPQSSRPRACASTFGGNTEVARPSSRRAASSLPRTPLGAAQQVQTSSAWGQYLGNGTLVRQPTNRMFTVYAVVEGETKVGSISVAPLGFGVFGATFIFACSA